MAYRVANLCLNGLNYYLFSKMVSKALAVVLGSTNVDHED
jgi:hypothetical protein